MVKKAHIPAEQVRRIRRALGVTQAEFARRLAVDAVTVARWETGKRSCSGLYAHFIARMDPEGRAVFEILHDGENQMSNNPKIISFFSHKGGVSKTTTTYNLGWALANQGRRVLLVDADPQCNLTGMTLSLSGDDEFEELYSKDERANLYGALRPAFEALPEPIEAIECYEIPQRPGLHLLPGHVSVSEYDIPLGVAYELTGSLGVMKNLPGAVSTLLRKCAEKYDIDFVLVDMSPAISAINQNFFMSSTHFIVPSSPDYFCELAIFSLAKVLPRWANWPKRAMQSDLFNSAAYPIPTHTPLFLGTINQRFRPRYGRPAQAFQRWIDRINETVSTELVPRLRENNMLLPERLYEKSSVNSEPFNLANISDFNSLIARSQENGVPVFELTDEQLDTGGRILENMKESRDRFDNLFTNLAKSLIDLTRTIPYQIA